MKEKGFTLIELIATPIVINIIEDSKASSVFNSAEHYIDAVQQAIMKYNMNNGENFIPKECEVQSDGNLKCDGIDIIVEVDGEKPTLGTITIIMGEISNIFLTYGDKNVVKDEAGNLLYGFKMYENGDEIYYNVDTWKKCSVSEAVSTTGTKSGCMKFYAFNDKSTSETVNLILDHNTTDVVEWNSSGSNVSGPSEVLIQLYNDTSAWVGTITPEDYTMDQSTQKSGSYYEVEYSKTPSIEGAKEPYKARLITAQEIAQITGADVILNWDETAASNWYYFDGAKGTDEIWQTRIANSTTLSDYGWLYVRISTTCTTYGCLNNKETTDYEYLEGVWGYWTNSSAASHFESAWYVSPFGGVYNFYVSDPDGCEGVRPVIEILKSNLL